MTNSSQLPSMNEMGNELNPTGDGLMPTDAESVLPESDNTTLANLFAASGISKEELSVLLSEEHFNHQY